jgi:hypothetical protein
LLPSYCFTRLFLLAGSITFNAAASSKSGASSKKSLLDVEPHKELDTVLTDSASESSSDGDDGMFEQNGASVNLAVATIISNMQLLTK